MAQHARKRAVEARMRNALAGDAIIGDAIAVGADQGKGRTDHVAHVVLGNRDHQHPGRTAILDQIVADHVDRIGAALARQFGDAAARVLRQMRRYRNPNAIPVRNTAPVVEAIARDLGADPRARLRQRQTRQHVGHAAGLHPLRQQIFQRIAADIIRIGIAIDVDAARLGRGDHVQGLCRFPPVVEAGAFEVHDLDVNLAGFRDVDRFLQRVEDLVQFVAQMREIAAVMALHDAAQRDDFVCGRIRARRREQAGGKSERTGPQALVEQITHRLQFAGRRRTIVHAHHHQAQRIVADQHAGVHRGRREAVEIMREGCFAKRQPRRARRQVIAQQLDLSRQHRAQQKSRNGR